MAHNPISYLGTLYQPVSSTLTTLAGITYSANIQSLLASADYSTARTNLGLAIGTNIQAYDADLTTWAGITPGTGVDTALAVNVGSAGAFVVLGGALGTPSSGTLTNCTFPTLNQNTTGTAAGLTTARSIGGVNFDGTGNIVPQTIQSVNEATDTTCFPLFISASGSQSLQPSNNAGFIYNSNTNALTATTFVGALTGTASGNLVSGGALGTPSSGTVTNLTGTASININGTVGATTPSTIVGTTITVNTSLLADADDGAVLGASGTGFSDLFLASGAVINFNAGDVLITHSANTLTFTGASSGYLYDAMNAPSTNDGAALGSGTLMWSDLFLASGSIINFNNGDILVTHSANTLTFTGASSGYLYDAVNAPNANDAAALGSTTLGWADVFVASGGVYNHNNGSTTMTGGTNIFTFGGSGANGNGIVLPTGGTSIASLNIPAGTLKTTAGDGDIEMDANCFYACTDAGNRGVVPVEHIIRQHANRTAFATGTAQQAIFDSVTNGTLTLETGAYLFEGMIQISATSATSGNLKFSLAGAGGGTFTVILLHIVAIDAANDTNTAPTMTSEIVSTQVATNMATATTATVTTFFVKGSFECTGAGTLIPSVAQTTSVGTAVTVAGSYFKCNRIGASTAVSIGQWT